MSDEPAASPDRWVFVVDQGGGSFTAYLIQVHDDVIVDSWVEKTRDLVKYLQSGEEDGTELKELLAGDEELRSILDISQQKATLADYSAWEFKDFGRIHRLLHLCYEILFNRLVAAHCPGQKVTKTVRQTGKIRARLLQRGRRAAFDRARWNEGMQGELGPDYDYALIETSLEALLEGTSFYRLNDLSPLVGPGSTVSAVAGLGVGSSSTQGYALGQDGKVLTAFDSRCGCGPTALEKAAAEAGNPKSEQQFFDQFCAILRKITQGVVRLYVHGAFGYALNVLFADMKGDEPLLCQTMAGEPLKVADLLRLSESKPVGFEENLLRGFFKALIEVAPQIDTILVKAKAIKSKAPGGLNVKPDAAFDPSLSWVRAGVLFGFDHKTESSIAAEHESILVGLTGTMGSGKSTVSEHLRARGALVIDADIVGHAIYDSPEKPAYRDLVGAFGDDIVAPDGSINRRALGRIVFADTAKLDILNQITWPRMWCEILSMIDAGAASPKGPPLPPADSAEAGGPSISEAGGAKCDGDCSGIAIVDAAILFRARWNEDVNQTWVVNCPRAVACKRIMARNGFSEEEALQRLSRQPSNDELVALGDKCVDNSANDGGAIAREAADRLLSSLLAEEGQAQHIKRGKPGL